MIEFRFQLIVASTFFVEFASELPDVFVVVLLAHHGVFAKATVLVLDVPKGELVGRTHGRTLEHGRRWRRWRERFPSGSLVIARNHGPC